MNKKLAISIGVLILVVVLAGLGFYYKSAFVAATVNGKPITRAALTRELDAQAGQQTLDTLINNALIDSAAKEKNINIKDSDIDAELNQIKSRVEAQGANFDDALKQQNLTMESLRHQIKIEQQLKALLGDKVTATDAEVDKYIADNKITVSDESGVTRDSVKTELEQQKFSSAVDDYIAGLKSKAKINIFLKF